MSPEQREANFRKLERYVFKYTSAWWGQSFVTELNRISGGDEGKEKPALKSAAEGVAGAATKAIQGAQEAVAGASGEHKDVE
jgi:trehalose 6-phosphate synthase